MEDSELTLVIKAQDEATAVLERTASAVDETQRKIEEQAMASYRAAAAADDLNEYLQTGSNEFTRTAAAAEEAAQAENVQAEASQKATVSADGLSSALIKQVAAYASIGAAINAVVGFFKMAIDQAEKEDQNTRILSNTLENLGLNSQAAGAEIESFVSSQQALGISMDEGMGIMTQLVTKTGDVKQSMAIMALAEDVAAAKGISLEEATGMLSDVLAGRGRRAMNEFGIQMEKNMKQGDLLAKIHDRVKGSAEKMADSTKTSGKVLKDTWEDFAQKIGKALLPVINNIEQGLTGVIKVVTAAGYALKGLASDLGNVGRIALDLVTGNWGAAFDHAKNWNKEASESFKKAGDEFMSAFVPMPGQVDKVTESNNELEKSLEGITKGLGAEGSGSGENVAQKVKDSMDELQSVFNDATAGITDANKNFLEESKNDYDAFVEKMRDITQQVEDLQREHEGKLNEIKRSAAEKRDEINANQLNSEVSAYQKYEDRLKKLPKEISDAQKAMGRATESGSTPADFMDAKQKLDDLTAEKDRIEKILKDNSGLADAAKKDRETDDITKARQKGQEQLLQLAEDEARKLKAENDAYNKAETALILHGNKEMQMYEDQKTKLVAKIKETYDRVAEAVQSGLEKVEKVKGLTKADKQLIATAAGSAVGSIRASEASSLDAVKNPTGAAAAQPITIKVLEGATVNATTQKGVEDLANHVATVLAQTMQTQRYGLATQR